MSSYSGREKNSQGKDKKVSHESTSHHLRSVGEKRLGPEKWKRRVFLEKFTELYLTV